MKICMWCLYHCDAKMFHTIFYIIFILIFYLQQSIRYSIYNWTKSQSEHCNFSLFTKSKFHKQMQFQQRISQSILNVTINFLDIFRPVRYIIFQHGLNYVFVHETFIKHLIIHIKFEELLCKISSLPQEIYYCLQ